MNQLARKDFVRTAFRSRLVDRALLDRRLREFLHDPVHEANSGEQFARYLVKTGDLTQYQAERLLAGRTEGFFLGNCKILDRIGGGGMGTVYRAEQLKLGRQVAIKVLPAQFVKDAEYVARFQREARAAAALKHPNVVQVYDVGQEGETHFIIMELVRGVNLEDRLEQAGSLSVADTADVIEQTARGLEHAHEHGVIHRDIKPSNLVLEGKTVKILDLGLARRSEAGTTITQETKGMGTPDYMSPEQFEDARRADARSDLYSLGCTWYHLLAGRPPFGGGSPFAKGLAHLRETAEPIRNLRADVPEDVALVIQKLMAKQPEDRYRSARELSGDLALLEIADDRAVSTTTDVAATMRAGVPAIRRRTPARPSPPPLAPAEQDSKETLIRTRTTGIPTLLLYLVPVMAALVLGGVYIGIRMIREQLQQAPPIVVDLPAPATRPAGDGAPQEGAAQEAATKKTEPLKSETARAKDKNQESTQKSTELALKSKDATKAAPPVKREPKTTRIENVDDFVTAWNQAGDGDRIEFADAGPFRLGPLSASGKRLTLASDSSRNRTLVVLTVPIAEQHGEGLWRIREGGLTLEHIDLCVDLRGRSSADSELVLLELLESDLRLTDSTITVVRGSVLNRSPVTAVKLMGERPWNRKAQGNAPAPLRLQMQDALIRGAHTALYVDSRQAQIQVENCVICTPGVLLRLFHTRKLEFAHHGMDVEIGSSTVDTDGPVVAIDCRPFTLTPAPIRLRVQSSLILSGLPAKASLPAQVCWQSPVDDKIVSTAIHWVGENNAYFRRGAGLTAKTNEGPLAIFVEKPDDWQRLRLGSETHALEPQRVNLPSTPLHRRIPANYQPLSPIGRSRIGAEYKRVASPLSLPGT